MPSQIHLLRAASRRLGRRAPLPRRRPDPSRSRRAFSDHVVPHRAAARRRAGVVPPTAVRDHAAAAAFSTQAASNDSFLSGTSGLYAEAMFEMYESDPASVPEVSGGVLLPSLQSHPLFPAGGNSAPKKALSKK